MDRNPGTNHGALSNEERKILAKKVIPMDVNPFEAEVIKELRKIRHGKYTVQVLDGIPIRQIAELSKVFFDGISQEELGIAASNNRSVYQR
jgi:hypothetical protein